MWYWSFSLAIFHLSMGQNYLGAFCGNKGNSNLILLCFQIFREKNTNFNILKLLIINQPSAVGCSYVKKFDIFVHFNVYTIIIIKLWKTAQMQKKYFILFFQNRHILAGAVTLSEKFSQNLDVNSPSKNKCLFAISHEQNNLFHLNFTSCKNRHQYYLNITQIFEWVRFFNFSKGC